MAPRSAKIGKHVMTLRPPADNTAQPSPALNARAAERAKPTHIKWCKSQEEAESFLMKKLSVEA